MHLYIHKSTYTYTHSECLLDDNLDLLCLFKVDGTLVFKGMLIENKSTVAMSFASTLQV